ncbi:S-layer homology domain-containing protein [Paenibacillus oceani]|uniref:S-layer homology domain-containing protein n=1 Tax=Paenibacillus oceani TaxID=2772510 RepID=A0A927H0L5_9BACL|nr:S-layer homology domain-containing protein [Paenibacillus oceani]MBD2863267.1 S-layer homology domain-containing protein [Paenibacillus oceani]
MLKRKISLVLIAALLFSLIHQFSIGTVYAADANARAVFGTGIYAKELFLGGKYMELGISQWGDFGTEGAKPANFTGTKVRKTIGMSADHDGFGTGKDLPIDYYLPGTMEERFAVGYKIGTKTFANSNSALMKTKSMPTTVENESDLAAGLLQAKVVSTWKDTMEITQVISFKVDDKIFRNDVTIKNISSDTWDSARYMRTLDPDNTKDVGGEFPTSNTITHTVADDGIAVVKAETYNINDPLYKAFNSRAPIFFYSKDPAAKGSIFGFTNTNPYAPDAYDNAKAKGYNVKADQAITMTWESNKLAPNESQTYTYYTSLDERGPDSVLTELEKDAGFKETKANDGTVAGTQRVVIKGGTLSPVIDPAKLTINNLPTRLKIGSVTRVSDTILEFTLSETDKAINHGSEYSITNASLTIGKENLVVGIKDYTTETFPITFIDQARAYISESNVTEATYGSGAINGSVTVTITDGVLEKDITKTDITVDKLPAGLDYTVERLSDKEFRLTFTGTAADPVSVSDASVTIASGKVAGSNGINLKTNTFNIDFYKKPYLFVENPVLKESTRNDGTFDEPIILKLVNGKFEDPTVAAAVYSINLPAGLSIGDVIRNNDTQLTIILTGSTTPASVTDNVYFGVDKSKVIPGMPEWHVTGDKVFSNTISFLFTDDYPSISLGEKAIHVNPDDTITEKLTVKLQNGTFDPGVAASHVKINNLPEGIEIDTVTLKSGSTTELEISFKVSESAKLEPASAFASVQIHPSVVVGATGPLTSETFAFNPAKADTVTWDMIKKFNSVQEAVRTDLKLLAEVIGGPVTWTSSNPAVIDTNGTVTRPAGKDEPVTLTATFTRGGTTVSEVFNVVVKKAPERLELIDVTVDDATPNQAKLTFNQDIAGALSAEDFKSFTIDGRKVIAATIDGDKAVVTFDEPLSPAPKNPLVVEYDQNEGNIVSAEDADNELSPISAGDQTGIKATNNIVPLQIVTSYVEDGKLKLIFNKPVDEAGLDLTGLEFGGKPVKAPFSVKGNEVVVALPEDVAGNVLTYVPGNIQHKDNPNNKLGQLLPGIDLGVGQIYIDPRGKLTDNGLGVVSSDGVTKLSPAFDQQIPNGYKATVPHYVDSVNLDPIPASATGTVVIVSVNGKEVDKASDKLPLWYGVNKITVGIYDKNNPNILLGQYEITIIREDEESDNTGTAPIGTGIGGGTPPKNGDIISSVNDNTREFATGKATTEGGRTVTTVQIDAGKLNDILAQGNAQKLAIRVPNEGDVEIQGLTAEQVKRIADSGSSLEIGNLLAIYPVPGGQLDFNAISNNLNGAKLGDIAVHVDIKRSPESLIDSAHSKATAEGYELLVDPVDLRLTFTTDGKTTDTDRLNGYAARYIALPEGIDPNRITTGVVINPDGTMFHLPTVVTKLNNRYFALINDLRSNGTYSVIWNPKDFDDVKNHWARTDVNNIAARLDLAGTGNNRFSPDRNIIRSEFATIVATGMGLMRQNVLENQFEDVNKSDWYHDGVSIASEFEIVLGYDDGLFHGGRNITREQGIAMIARAFNLVEPQRFMSPAEIDATLLKFGDADNVSGWAKEVVAKMVAAGIVEGEDGQLLNPQDYMSRAEAAALMRRLLQMTNLID